MAVALIGSYIFFMGIPVLVKSRLHWNYHTSWLLWAIWYIGASIFAWVYFVTPETYTITNGLAVTASIIMLLYAFAFARRRARSLGITKYTEGSFLHFSVSYAHVKVFEILFQNFIFITLLFYILETISAPLNYFLLLGIVLVVHACLFFFVYWQIALSIFLFSLGGCLLVFMLVDIENFSYILLSLHYALYPVMALCLQLVRR